MTEKHLREETFRLMIPEDQSVLAGVGQGEAGTQVTGVTTEAGSRRSHLYPQT